MTVCGLRKVGLMAARGRKAHVPLSAPSAREKLHLFSVLIDVTDDFSALRITHKRAAGNFEDDVGTLLAEALIGAAALAVARRVFGGKAVGEQIVHVLVRDEVDVAAVPAVAAVGTARGLALVCLEGIHAVAAVTRLDGDAHFVGKDLVIHTQSIASFLEKGKAFFVLSAICAIFSASFVKISVFLLERGRIAVY